VKRRIALAFLLVLAAAPGAQADDAAMVRAIYRDWMVPRSSELAAASTTLVGAVRVYCSASPQDAVSALDGARRAWTSSVVAWERVSTVAIGPMLEERVQARLDFMPARPRMIAQAIERAPSDGSDMDRIGAPAKGFPALEWLLWTRAMQPASAECRYATQIAQEIEREARSLERAFETAAAVPMDAKAAKAALNEFANQWIGGLDRLRWTWMVQPVQRAATAERRTSAEFPRNASGATAQSWAAQWATLSQFAVAAEGSFSSMLRERGFAKLADSLAQAVERADADIKGLDPSDPEQVMAAARQLSALKGLVEGNVATALDLRIGFSDADGD
jgi:predicted lipoprotein